MVNNSNMRVICFLITGLSYGGAENQLLTISKILKKRGWDVHIVSMCRPIAYTENFNDLEIQVYSLEMKPGFPDIRGIWRFCKIIKKINPMIVHSHMIHANIFARISRMLCMHKNLICTAHNIYEGQRWREIAYRFTDHLCELTTNVCQAGVDRSVQRKIVPKSKIMHVPNGIEFSNFFSDISLRETTRKQLGIENKFTFLAVGRFENQKDYPNMLLAFARLLTKESRVVLLIAGTGVLKNDMHALSVTLGIAESVHFLGLRRDIPMLMNAADGYVMSSAWEGLPIVLLEAAASGLPIIATNVGGNCEIVIDGFNGFLVPSRDDSSLAIAMEKLVNLDEILRSSMSDASREVIKQNFDVEHVVDKWESLYHEYC